MTPTPVAESDKLPPSDFGRNHKSEESVLIRTTRVSLNLITHVLIVMTVFICLLFAWTWSTRTLNIFEWHIILCVLGYQFFMNQGILVLSKYNSWSMYLPRLYKRHLHWILQLVGIILATVGSTIMSVDVHVNFTTAHGISGVCALIVSLIGLFNGIIAWYAQKTSYINAYWIKMVHIVTGIGAIFLSAASLCWGINIYAFKMWSSEGDVIALIIFTLIFSVLVAIDFWILICRKICC
ncbi:uncharacterized protein LOC126374274 [Pectinophora gossypiella]|uniref:uncharacterized protein LOC126374274 n=1 Tax=Pectinophora gossypiella TaxID=13191 RepID=UPI00214EDFAC|nr:uncharacterized protein LOC126374274 [Pectinophora gossypiella]